jgi:hypothetical protein
MGRIVQSLQFCAIFTSSTEAIAVLLWVHTQELSITDMLTKADFEAYNIAIISLGPVFSFNCLLEAGDQQLAFL